VYTCDSHAVAPFQRIPDHRPVRDGQERLGDVLRRRCEGREGGARTAQDEGLKARRGEGSVRHDAGLEELCASRLDGCAGVCCCYVLLVRASNGSDKVVSVILKGVSKRKREMHPAKNVGDSSHTVG
jgi:hypothetical protein